MTAHQDESRDVADLRARFESAAPAIVVDPAPVVRRGRRRRAVARAGTGVGVAAVLLAVTLLVRPAGSSAPVAGGPPPEPTRPVAFEIAPQVVTAGEVVTAVLVAREENDLTFGVATQVDRWDGDEWQPAGVARLCLDFWECVGSVTDRLGPVEDIGVAASPAHPGPDLLLGTEGLEEGWYRLWQSGRPGQDGTAADEHVAAGVFEVRSGTRTSTLDDSAG